MYYKGLGQRTSKIYFARFPFLLSSFFVYNVRVQYGFPTPAAESSVKVFIKQAGNPLWLSLSKCHHPNPLQTLRNCIVCSQNNAEYTFSELTFGCEQSVSSALDLVRTVDGQSSSSRYEFEIQAEIVEWDWSNPRSPSESAATNRNQLFRHLLLSASLSSCLGLVIKQSQQAASSFTPWYKQ